MITLVKQDTPHSCGLACLAMVLGTDMDGAREIVGRTCEEEYAGLAKYEEPFVGVFEQEMTHILFQHGIPTASYADPKYWPEEHWLRKCWYHLAQVKLSDVRAHLDAGGKAIVGVPSLNIPDGSHWIVVSGGKIFDPSPKRVYEDGMPMEIEQAILIGQPQLIMSPAEMATLDGVLA